MTELHEIVIVRDGQTTWGADKAEIVAALEAQGWTKRGKVFIEPEPKSEPADCDNTNAYTELCQAVRALPGMDSDDTFDHNHPDADSFAWDGHSRAWHVTW